ncbi:hypothetical protein GCM10009413_10480 [Tatumella punctata]
MRASFGGGSVAKAGFRDYQTNGKKTLNMILKGILRSFLEIPGRIIAGDGDKNSVQFQFWSDNTINTAGQHHQ